MKISFITILFLFQGASICVFGLEKEYLQYNLSTEDGLSSNVYFDLKQDHKGYIWVATNDGLNRYDGNEVKVYYPDRHSSHSIHHNVINRIFIDFKFQDTIFTSIFTGKTL